MSTKVITSQKLMRAMSAERQRLFPLLLCFACITECLYLLLLALAPLPWLHLSSTPLLTDWSWTLLPARLLLAGTGALLTTASGKTILSPLLLGVTLLALVAIYGWAIVHGVRTAPKEKPSRLWLLFLFGSILIFGLTLLLQPRLFSDDVFTYIFSGRILAVYHANPLNTAPGQFPTDLYVQWVIAGRDAPNIYGPLWLCVTWLLVGFGGNAVTTLLLFKGLALLAHLVNCLLVWSILGKTAPTRQLPGTLLYAWNPLALIELAGSGHSEGLLLTLLLLATWLYVCEAGRWRIRRTTGVLLIFGLAIGTNTIVLLLAPLYIWFDIRTHRTAEQVFWSFLWRAVLVALPALAVSLPFWRGASTFFAITSAIDMQHFVHSPVGLLAGPLGALFTAVAHGLHLAPFLQPVTSAEITLRASATFIFALIYFNLFGQVRRAPTTLAGMRYSPDADQETLLPGFDVLVRSWCLAIFWYVVLVSGWFWPWYVLWMFWTVTLRRFDTITSTVIVLTNTALFLYVFLSLPRAILATYQSALIFGIPLLYLVVMESREKWQERKRVLL